MSGASYEFANEATRHHESEMLVTRSRRLPVAVRAMRGVKERFANRTVLASVDDPTERLLGEAAGGGVRAA